MHLMLMKKGTERYATAANSKRIGGKVVKTDSIYLGRVVDLEKGIFESRERGVFSFDVETGEFGRADTSDLPPRRRRGRRQLTVDFGDVYVLDRFMRESGIMECIDECSGCNTDTLKSMTAYYILTKSPNSWAADWYDGSYASVLYPGADMDDRRLSEFLKALGDPAVQRRFFGRYIGRFCPGDPVSILIDSTGIPNSVHMPVTAVSNHNGDVNLEVRLVMVCRKSDRLPLFARYVPGNVVDSQTLVRTIDELGLLGVVTDYVIVDAGYCTLENMRELIGMHINFITRIRPNFDMFKEMVEDNLGRLDADSRQLHNGRFMRVYSEKRSLKGCDEPVWIHLVQDEDMKNAEEKRRFEKLLEGKVTKEDYDGFCRTAGVFALISSYPVDSSRILDAYYERGSIEQLFDTGKGDCRLSEAAVHSEESFSGKVFLDFIAIAVSQMLQNRFKERKERLSSKKRRNKGDFPGSGISPAHALGILRNQKCDIYENRVLPRECSRRINEVYELMGYESPRFVDKA